MNKRKRNNIDEILKTVNVVSQEEAENVDVVICMPDGGTSYFTDDVRSHCATCGIPIRHRPHVPKRPLKVCFHCGLSMAEQDKAGESGQSEAGQRALRRKHAGQQKLRKLRGD